MQVFICRPYRPVDSVVAETVAGAWARIDKLFAPLERLPTAH